MTISLCQIIERVCAKRLEVTTSVVMAACINFPVTNLLKELVTLSEFYFVTIMNDQSMMPFLAALVSS